MPPPGDYANSCVGRERMFEYFSAQARHAGPAVPAELRDRHALRRAARHRPQGARRRDDRSRDGPCQRDLAGRRQRDGAALPAHATTPTTPINVTGPETFEVAKVADEFGRLLGKTPKFTGKPAPTGWINNAARMVKEFGPPGVPLAKHDRMECRLAGARHGDAQQADALRSARWHVLTRSPSTPIDVEHAEAVWPLSIEAGWNQNVADWRFMLGAGRGFGCATATADGRRARWSCRSASGSPGSAWCWSPRIAAAAASAPGC